MSVKTATSRLKKADLEVTDHRVQVLMAIGNTTRPSSASEILEKISAKKDINRVTVYRILDLLVEHQVLNRLGLGEKSQRFCLRSAKEDEHPHFHCTRCDSYLCLSVPDLPLDRSALDGLCLDIRHVDIRLEGICPACQDKADRS
jgi:Fur family transcriptional regulator, ferric uptake regulator